jgi:hypothetical protein
MITDRIQAYLNTDGKPIPEALLLEVGKLASYSFSRQFGVREERKAGIRLSAIGKCTRQNAYKLLGVEENGKKIDARAKTIFFLGDLVELAVVALAKAAGCDVTDTGDQQLSVELDGVSGHPDGLLRDSGKTYLLEVKSMSSHTFSDFEKGIVDIGYIYQINSYLEALKLDKCVIVAFNKDSGVIAELIISKDLSIVKDIKDRIVILKNIVKENLPERPYQPNPKGFLPWQCLYCAHWMTCWPDAEKVLVSGRYKLHLQTKGEITPWDTETPRSSKTASSSKSKKASPIPYAS